MGIDLNTYRSYEHGRRPLARVTVQRLRSITRGLTAIGVAPAVVDLIDVAIDVDLAIGKTLAEELFEYPFPPGGKGALWHELLAWAVIGTTPNAFADNGVVATPPLSAPDRNTILRQIRYTVDRQDASLDAGTLQYLREVYLGIPPCPSWCGLHYRASEAEAFHQHDLDASWGRTADRYGEEKLGLAIERMDDVDGIGTPMVSVQYSTFGDMPEGTVELPLDTARDFAQTILSLCDMAQGASL
jgi:hypothetical protein